MRYVFSIGFALALGLMLSLGCNEGAQCEQDEDCDDQNECTHDRCQEGTCSNVPSGAWDCDFDGVPSITPFEDGICVEDVCVKSPCDDGNECTIDEPPLDGACFHIPQTGSLPCDWSGEPGVCVEGACVEDVCLSLVCDDGNECTFDYCGFGGGGGPPYGCHFPTDYPGPGAPCDWNGASGVCIEGVCGQDPCELVVCDDGDLCTIDSCWLGECTHGGRCHDRNGCTFDNCDPETGECSNPPADGESCCWSYFCFGDSCVCLYGTCLDGVCR